MQQVQEEVLGIGRKTPGSAAGGFPSRTDDGLRARESHIVTATGRKHMIIYMVGEPHTLTKSPVSAIDEADPDALRRVSGHEAKIFDLLSPDGDRLCFQRP